MLKGPGPDGRRRWRACHTGGGLIMKEFLSPWVNWDGQNENPNSQEIVDQIGEGMGLPKVKDFRNEEHSAMTRFAGAAMQEQFVEPSNQRNWDPTRVSALKKKLGSDAGATAELLRPLFCTVEMNLLTTSDNNQAGLSSIPGSFFLDSQLGAAPAFGSFNQQLS